MNNLYLKIYCKFSITKKSTLSNLNLSNMNSKQLLDTCFNILYSFMNGSYSNNLYSQIIQSLFIQQLKFTHSFGDLLWYGTKSGQESIIRTICELYIRIHWLLGSNNLGDGRANKDRFNRYKYCSAYDLLKFKEEPKLKFIKRNLHKALIGKLKNKNIMQLRENINKMTEDLTDSFYNDKKLSRVGINIQYCNVQSLLKKYKMIGIKQMAKGMNGVYQIYSSLCHEMHAYLPYIIHNNMHTNSKNEYYAKINNFYKDDLLLINYNIIFLTCTFNIMNNNNIFIDKDYPRIIYLMNIIMHLLNNKAVGNIVNNINKLSVISYVKSLKF